MKNDYLEQLRVAINSFKQAKAAKAEIKKSLTEGREMANEYIGLLIDGGPYPEGTDISKFSHFDLELWINDKKKLEEKFVKFDDQFSEAQDIIFNLTGVLIKD